MALLAVLLCVGISSCSKEDDLGGNGDVTSGGKKLAKIVQTYESGDSEEVIFSYDDKGRLISCYRDGDIYQYSWSDNTITRTRGNDVRTYSYIDALVRKEERDYYTYDYAYNSSKQIIALNIVHKNSNKIEQKEVFSWENGKIAQIVYVREGHVPDTLQFTYGSKTCKGHNPFITMSMTNTRLFWVHPELIGITYYQLPTNRTSIGNNRETVKNISYTLDKDGYVIGCFVEEISKTNGEESKITYTYTFTWE